MTEHILTREQVRRVDHLAVRKHGMSGLVLMENAGRGLADRLCEMGIDGPVVICCGRGNNAGDGFVLARHLDLREHRVRLLTWGDPEKLSEDAAANYRILQRTGFHVEVLREGHDPRKLAEALHGASWAVDALLGTGAVGAPRSPLDAVIEQLNASDAPILAVDLPSGLDCDTGEAAQPTVRATATCTFVAAKPGLVASAAADYVGRLFVLDIGVPPHVIDEAMFEAS